MCADRTPCSTACTHAAIFGIMPPVSEPLSINACSSFGETRLINDDGSPASWSSPSTSVK